MVVEDVFVAIVLLRFVRVGMVLFFPLCIQVVHEALVSFSRIQVHTPYEVEFQRFMQSSLYFCSDETKIVNKAAAANSAFCVLLFVCGRLLAASTLMTFACIGGHLSADVAFVTLALFSPISVTLSRRLPRAAQATAECSVSLLRIQVSIQKHMLDFVS